MAEQDEKAAEKEQEEEQELGRRAKRRAEREAEQEGRLPADWGRTCSPQRRWRRRDGHSLQDKMDRRINSQAREWEERKQRQIERVEKAERAWERGREVKIGLEEVEVAAFAAWAVAVAFVAWVAWVGVAAWAVFVALKRPAVRAAERSG